MQISTTHIPIGELKVDCYHILDQAQEENQKLVFTKIGSPISEIIPLGTQIIKKSVIGMMISKDKINGDILTAIETKWEAEND